MFTYNQFRSQLKGKGFSNIDQSVLWSVYKEGRISDEQLNDPITLKIFLGTQSTKPSPTVKSPRRKSGKRSPRLRLASAKTLRKTAKKSPPQTTQMLDYFGTTKVPKEVIWGTMMYLPIKSIRSWCSTNKYFRDQVCTEDFWQFFVHQKYGISVKLFNETWKDMSIKYSKVYDIYDANMATKRGKIRNAKPIMGYDGKYRKFLPYGGGILSLEKISPKFFITENFELREENKIDPLMEDVIDVNILKIANIYSPERRGVDAMVIIKKDGSVFYGMLYEGILSEFIELDLIAAKVFDSYLVTPEGSLIKYEIDKDGKIKISKINTPVPFIYTTSLVSPGGVEGSGYTIYVTKRSLAIDFQGNVWGIGSNENSTLGINQRYVDHFVRLEGLLNIKKVAAGYFGTLFLDKDDEMWACGLYDRLSRKNQVLLRIPTKLNQKATDIVYASPYLYFIDNYVVYYVDKPGVYKRQKVFKSMVDPKRDELLFLKNTAHIFMYVGDKT